MTTPFTCPGCGAATDNVETLAGDCVDFVTGIGRCPARTEVAAAAERRRQSFRRLIAGDPVGVPVLAGDGSRM